MRYSLLCRKSLLAEQRQRLAKGEQAGAAESHGPLTSVGQQGQAFLAIGQKTKPTDSQERKSFSLLLGHYLATPQDP